MGTKDGEPCGPRPTRRAILFAAGGAVLLAACGGDDKAKSKSDTAAGGKPGPDGKTRKTTKRVHPKAQASASRSKTPLPPELQAYVSSKVEGGALVRGPQSNVVHHPVLCKRHLPSASPAPRERKQQPPAQPVLHGRYADGILYSLIRAEADPKRAAGLAILAGLAWPVSRRFADLALATLGRDAAPEAARVAEALAAATGGAPDAAARRTEAAVALLRGRLAERAAAATKAKERAERGGR